MNKYHISDMKQGQKAMILRMPNKGHSGFRLAELGLRHGQIIIVTSVQPLKGPVIIRIGQADVAIGHSVAGRIEVELTDL